MGDVNKINFNDKKGLFSKEKEATLKFSDQQEPIWLKNTDKTETMPKGNSHYIWSNQDTSTRDPDDNRVIKLNEERKPETKQVSGGTVSKLSAENMTNFEQDNTSRKPRMKMNVTPTDAKKVKITFCGKLY